MTYALRACPCCGAAVETCKALRAVATCGGAPVLEEQEVFACTGCEWVRSVRGEDYRRRVAALEDR